MECRKDLYYNNFRYKMKMNRNIYSFLVFTFLDLAVVVFVGNPSGLHPTTSPNYRDENNKGNMWKDAQR